MTISKLKIESKQFDDKLLYRYYILYSNGSTVGSCYQYDTFERAFEVAGNIVKRKVGE